MQKKQVRESNNNCNQNAIITTAITTKNITLITLYHVLSITVTKIPNKSK